MKIAVPLFGKRISPHFGASSRILLVETEGGRIISKTIMDAGTNDGGRIARDLVSLAVTGIICGGIQRIHKQWLTENGIEVIENCQGQAEEFVAKLVTQIEQYHQLQIKNLRFNGTIIRRRFAKIYHRKYLMRMEFE
ncbi:MAG: NifB/NifX family molybdenum-iron cluster-binding protein [Desulfobacterales bacterium]|nr:NifB/NifX family molybdenum-iron cluster-binding protein [Desulfobacterales bacterium]